MTGARVGGQAADVDRPANAASRLVLELSIDPRDLPALRRLLRGRLRRARTLSIQWFDGDDEMLTGQGVALAERHEPGVPVTTWIEPLAPTQRLAWPIGSPPPAIATAAHAQAGIELPARLDPFLRFDGRVRRAIEQPDGVAAVLCDGVTAVLCDGIVIAGTNSAECARLTLQGPLPAMTGLARSLVAEVRMSVPTRSLAAEARALVGLAVPDRVLGAAVLPAGLSVEAAFAHVVGHLGGVMLHYAPRAAAGQIGEPVHQMRVALRRLRSATTVFGRVVDAVGLTEVRHGLRTLAGVLGPARDWDVFLVGTGASVAAAFPEEPAVAQLLAAAQAQRAAAYIDLAGWLSSAALRDLAVQLAVLAAGPAEDTDDNTAGRDAASAALIDLARHSLSRRRRKLLAPGRDITALPDVALHEIRLTAKRMRYAAEVFAPLFPDRATPRFLRRLGDLQEALGALNDGAVASTLMQALADDGGTALAGGMVRGFVAADAAGARGRIADAWRKVRKAEVFWK